MKRNTALLLLGACMAVMLASNRARSAEDIRPTRAAALSSGVITGRVQNAATGRYLTNARVAVKGTDLVAFTDEFGMYRLAPVSSGPVVIEIFYTGLDPQQFPLQVSAGQALVQDVNLTNIARYGQNTDPVKLDAFVVATAREVEGEALATNEQRFSANIKKVVAADAFGDIQEGNVGEFVKFLPGVTVGYVSAEAREISLRGFSPNLTTLTTDGAQVSNANYFGSARAPFMSQTSINNISRVEVSKVPTPSSPADSLAGSINLVSKSAFERSRAEFRYRTYLSANSHRLSLSKSPYTVDDTNSYKVLPNFDFDYTRPIGRNFGIVVTGMSTNFFNEQRFHQTIWTAAAAGTTASLSQPFLSSEVTLDAPRYTWRKAFGLNADWRVTPNSVLSVGVSASHFQSQGGQWGRTAQTGTNGVPTITVVNGGVPFSSGSDFTIGATGRGAVSLSADSSNRYENTTAGKLRYRFDNGDWRINANIVRSASSAKFRGAGSGWVFTGFAAAISQPVRVAFSNIAPLGDGDSPTVVRVYANDGHLLDPNDINLYQISSPGVSVSVRDITDDVSSGEASVRRSLGFLSFPAALQIGGLHRVQKRDSSLPVSNFNPTRVLAAAPFQTQVYVNQDSGFGARNYSYIDIGKASRAFTADRSLFAQTPAQVVASATSRINTSEFIREAVSAYYVQAELQLLRNRLKILTGVRSEETTGDGQGPVFDPAAAFVRNPNGSFARDPQGQRIRKPEAGAAGSIEELRVTRKERGNRASGSNDGYFPSLHLTYTLRENFLARAAYAKTYGRPNFNEIIPNVVITERDLTADQLADPTVLPGTMTVRNTNLKPWTADNYDVSLEYYTDQGGTITAAAFVKEIRDFFSNDVRIATAADVEQLGLDARYAGYQMTTKINAGNARVSGVELSLRHSLAPLGAWGRHFTVFANATKLNLGGDRGADFAGFVRESVGWGVTFARGPATVMAKWNWRGEQKNGAFAALGPDAFNYVAPRLDLDLSLDYQLGKRLSVFLNIRNVFDERTIQRRYGSATPAYARVFNTSEFGAQWAAGIKGSF